MHALSFSRYAGILLSVLLLVCSFSPPGLRLWRYENDALQQVAPAEQLLPLPGEEVIEVSGGNSPLQIILKDEQLYIYTQSSSPHLLWQSPPEWRVKQVQVTDLNRDGNTELALLVWRQFEPWPIDRYLPYSGRIAGHQDRRGQSCHLVLVGWRSDGFGELWAGSALVQPLHAILAADLDNDGWQELAALEGQYDDPVYLPSRALSLWEWNGFGFSLLTRQPGRFHGMAAALTPKGETRLLVHGQATAAGAAR